MSRQLYRSFHVQQAIDKQEDIYNDVEREYKNLVKTKDKTSEQMNQMLELRDYIEEITKHLNYLEEL